VIAKEHGALTVTVSEKKQNGITIRGDDRDFDKEGKSPWESSIGDVEYDQKLGEPLCKKPRRKRRESNPSERELPAAEGGTPPKKNEAMARASQSSAGGDQSRENVRGLIHGESLQKQGPTVKKRSRMIAGNVYGPHSRISNTNKPGNELQSTGNKDPKESRWKGIQEDAVRVRKNWEADQSLRPGKIRQIQRRVLRQERGGQRSPGK